MRRKTIALIAVAAALAAAAAAFGAVGDVISSFHIPRELHNWLIYRDADHVYVVDDPGYGMVILTYTVDGSFVRSMPLEESGNYPNASDHSPKGAGYFALFEVPPLPSEYMYVVSYDLATGSVVDSIYILAHTIYWVPVGFAYVPRSRYMYCAIARREHGPYRTIRYTIKGEWAGNIVDRATGLGATPLYNSQEGEYVILAGSPTQVYTSSGSLVGSFTVPGSAWANVCGPGAPSSYKTTYWYLTRINYEYYCYQIDLGNTTKVAPASLGKIKALYR
jgi:hypothetical protein